MEGMERRAKSTKGLVERRAKISRRNFAVPAHTRNYYKREGTLVKCHRLITYIYLHSFPKYH
jgi:hypothetical protein